MRRPCLKEKEQAWQQDRFLARTVVYRENEGIALGRNVIEAMETANLTPADERYAAHQQAVDLLEFGQRPGQNGARRWRTRWKAFTRPM